MATNSFGRIGRLGTAVLKELQYCHRGPLIPRHKQALAFHRDLIMALPPRQVQVVRREQRRVVVLYSDAEYEPESGRQPHSDGSCSSTTLHSYTHLCTAL